MDPDVAVVTGGAQGLGAVLVRTLATGGRHVLVADRDEEAGTELVRDVMAGGGAATFVAADLATPEGVDKTVAAAARTGRVRLLVNNAGGWLPGPKYPDTPDWGRALDLNLRMPMLAVQRALPLLRDGGAVVNVASSGGSDAGAYGSPEYGAAKAGLIRFTTSTADFEHRYGIRVSCVVPHWIGLPRAVEQHARLTSDEQRRSGGLIEPQVVADAVVALADDPTSGGRVLVLRAGRPPYAITGAIDPDDRPT